MSVDVDHVVAHAGGSVVGHSRGQLRVARARWFNEAQGAARQRYDDVIEGMNVLSRFCTRGERPLGYDYALVVDLYGRNGFHVCLSSAMMGSARPTRAYTTATG